MATDQARLAVDSRAFPLMVYDPRKGDRIRERLSLQGNPAVNDDWWKNSKTGNYVDFIDFARSEGRFAKNFDKEGKPSEVLLRANQDRLENWHVLQELAGIFDKKPAVASKEKPESDNGHSQKLSIGSRIKYFDGSDWITGKIESLAPARLTLDDDTEIQVAGHVLRQAVQDGVVVVQ